MPLNTPTGREDEAPLLDGDDRFLKVVMRGHPALLPPGSVPLAVNLRFRDGVAEPRGGSVKPAWLNQISGTSVSAWDSVQGRGHYVDAQRRQWTLLAVNGGVRAIFPHNPPRAVPLPAGVTLTGSVQFLQTGSTVLLLRGDAGDTLQMTDLTAGFTAVPAAATPGLSSMPAARRGVVAGDRVWLVTTTNQIWASDLLDHTSYHPLNQFKVGDRADEIVTLALFGQTRLIVFLKQSVYALTGILTPDAQGLLSNTTAPRITARYGCLAADSVVDIGTDLVWLCPEGLASLTLTTEGEVQSGAGPTRPPMFSDDIQPLITRIRWDYAGAAQGAFWDGRLYMAVPLDEAEAFGPEKADGRRTSYSLVVVAGATYRFTPGGASDTLTNGGDTYGTATDFTADGTTVDLNDASQACSLRRVYKGVNNAVLVYDFKALAPGWQGHDEAEGILFPRHFLRRDYNGRDRLFFLNGDGWGTLYEEGPEDAIGQPYVDVLVTASPAAGNTINVNAAGAIPAIASATNAAAQWGNGLGNATTAAANLYVNSGIGYAEVLFLGSWPVGAANVSALGPAAAPTGVRFTSTNGRLPSVVTTGSWATLEIHQWQPIVTAFLSRGLATPVPLERKSARKLQVLVETWHPRYTVALKSEGVNDETVFVSAQTRSRTRYARPFHKQAWDADNDNNDFATPGREDYSLTVSTPFQLGDGLGVQLHQEAEHGINVKGRARAHQIRITNDQGRVRILGLGYEGRRRERGHGVKI